MSGNDGGASPRIDHVAAWEEILPLIRRDKHFADLTAAAILDFWEGSPAPERYLPKPGMNIWTHAGAPWKFSRSDYWCDRPSPRQKSVYWFGMRMGCHWIVYPLQYALNKWQPDAGWRIVKGADHSTLVYANGTVFDILYDETCPCPLHAATCGVAQEFQA